MELALKGLLFYYISEWNYFFEDMFDIYVKKFVNIALVIGLFIVTTIILIQITEKALRESLSKRISSLSLMSKPFLGYFYEGTCMVTGLNKDEIELNLCVEFQWFKKEFHIRKYLSLVQYIMNPRVVDGNVERWIRKEIENKRMRFLPRKEDICKEHFSVTTNKI